MTNLVTERIGIDGMERSVALDADGCCVPSLCSITASMLACNFVHALPRGPLWDKAKALVLEANGPQCDQGICPPEVCHSIVSHAVYTGNRLWTLLMEALWPALHESDPFTCYDTVDDWLERYGWQSCFDSACRSDSLGVLTPLEVFVSGCRTYVPPTFDPELSLAVKLGIVRSLARLDMGVVPNLERINFVLEPLGAVVIGAGVGFSLDGGPCSMTPPSDGLPGCDWPIDHPILEICNVGTTFPKPVRPGCSLATANEPNLLTIPAYHTRTVDDNPGLPLYIWPGVLAAECILRSVIYPGQHVEITRCEGTP